MTNNKNKNNYVCILNINYAYFRKFNKSNFNQL